MLRRGKTWFKISGLLGAGVFLLASIGSCSTRTWIYDWAGPSPFAKFPAGSMDSIREFFASVRPAPGNPDSHYRLACYYQERGDHRKAIEEFSKVLRIDPKHVRALSGLGVSHDSLKDFSQAQTFYRMALWIDPQLAYVHNNLGYSHLLAGNPDAAIAALKEATALSPLEGTFRNNLGLAYALKGELDLALVEFQKAADASKAHFNVAQFYARRGLYRLAQVHYSLAFQIDPSFSHARMAARALDTLTGIFRSAEEDPAPASVTLSSPSPGTRDSSKTPEPAAPAEPIQAHNPPIPQDPSPVTESPQKQALAPTPWAGEPGTAQGRAVDSPSPPPQTDGIASGVFAPANPPSVPASQPSPRVSPAAGTRFSWGHIGIEVSNGNGVNGMARRVGQHLKEKGAPVKRYTNASHFKYRETRIYYQNGHYQAACQVADQLPGSQQMEARKKMDRPGIHIKVLLGRDLATPEEYKRRKPS